MRLALACWLGAALLAGCADDEPGGSVVLERSDASAGGSGGRVTVFTDGGLAEDAGPDMGLDPGQCPPKRIGGDYNVTSPGRATGVTHVDGVLLITGADVDTDSTFDCLQQVGRGIILQDLPNLTEITGFNNLRSVGEGMHFSRNGLTSITGFNGLEEIHAELWIEDSIETLEGFDSLANVLRVTMGGPESCAAAAFTNRMKEQDIRESLELPPVEIGLNFYYDLFGADVFSGCAEQPAP